MAESNSMFKQNKSPKPKILNGIVNERERDWLFASIFIIISLLLLAPDLARSFRLPCNVNYNETLTIFPTPYKYGACVCVDNFVRWKICVMASCGLSGTFMKIERLVDGNVDETS